MIFDSLKDKCEYYRGLGERRLMPNGHIIMMLDGRAFSKLIKNKFNKPFDDRFIGMMNDTAKYLCENISGVKFAYVQSDEISLYIHDDSLSGSFFGLRQTKLLSVPAAMAAGRFNQLYLHGDLMNRMQDSMVFCDEGAEVTKDQIIDTIKNQKLAEFDCKVWNVPNENDVFAWFLYRQLDCVRNSKQQTAQTWLSHKMLSGKDSDEQIELLKQEKNIDWEVFDEGKKYGRLITKVEKEVEIPQQYVKDGVTTTMRTFWETFEMPVLNEEGGKEKLMELIEKE